MSSRPPVLALFFAVFLLYLSMSPFSTVGMGYVHFDVAACRAAAGSGHSLREVDWGRNGPAAVLLECPFVLLGDAAGGPAWGDRALSIQPVAATAGIVTLLFVWCSRLGHGAGFALALSLTAGFATMLWPYAYIGLETTQALALLAAGFLALGDSRRPRWPAVALFTICCVFAVASKSNGVMLAPAVGYLIWSFAARWGRAALPVRAHAARALAILAVVAAAYLLNASWRIASWERFGGTGAYLRGFRARSVVAPLLHLVGFIGSPNKGLLVFAPVAVVALVRLPAAWRRNRPVAVFAVLSVAGLAGGFSLLDLWAEDTWGPRYLHAAIAPLVLSLAASYAPGRRAGRPALVLSAAAGLAVSILGVLFYYGAMGGVAMGTTDVFLETYQGDPLWNHVEFNARLAEAWIRRETGHDRGPAFVAAGHNWNFRSPGQVPNWKPVDVRPFAVPQPLILRGRVIRPEDRPVRIFAGLCLLGGLAFLVQTAIRASRPSSALPGPPGSSRDATP